MAQQTAVKWLIEQLSEKQPNGFYVIDTLEDVKRVFKQAKEMEKEQHGTTWDKALNAYEDRGHLYIRAWTDFDEYFKETYGS